MSAENLILGVFAFLPVMLVVLLVFAVRRFQPRRKASRMVQLLLGNTLVLLFLGSLMLLGGEIYYRFIYDTTDSFGLMKTTQRWVARHIHLNASGVRDSVALYPLTPPPNQRRITFIGDSFTVGHGVANVEDRFGNRLRRQRPEWEVHLFAWPGDDTGAELDHLRHLIESRYKLDIVVLAYCLNDISDIVPEWETIMRRIFKKERPGFLVRHSYFINTLHYRWQSARDPDVKDYYQFVHEAYAGPLWEAQEGRLSEFRRMVEAANGRLMVVTFPFFHALGPEYRYRTVHEKFGQFWREEKVPHLDLLEKFNHRPPAEWMVNSRDPHPNERAHVVAAEAIAEFLQAQVAKDPIRNHP